MKLIKGLYTDCHPKDQPEGTYRYGKNIVLNKRLGAVGGEDGFEPIETKDYSLVVQGYTYDRNRIIIIGKSRNQQQAYIDTIASIRDDELTIHVRDSHLGLSDKNVKAYMVYNDNDESLVVFSDDENQLKLYNVDNPPFTVKSDFSIENDDIYLGKHKLLKFFPDISVPYIKNAESISGGTVKVGTYFFSIAYKYPEGGYTDYFSVSNPVVVPKGYRGADPGELSSRSVKLHISDLDLSFPEFKLGIIKYNGEEELASEIRGFDIKSPEQEVLYTGESSEIPILIEEITTNNARYEKVGTFTLHNNELYVSDLSTKKEKDFQSVANNIQVGWNTDKIDLGGKGSIQDTSVMYTKKSFMPGEVYALYIAFINKDGTYTPAFHIPGRAERQIPKSSGQMETALIKGNKEDLPGDSFRLNAATWIDSEAKWFQLMETADSSGSLGYWENEELYPEKFPGTQNDELAGKPVRHHKMPTMSELNKFDPEDSIFSPGKWTRNRKQTTAPGIKTLGLKLSNIYIPSSLRENIQGYEIFYAKRRFDNSNVVFQTARIYNKMHPYDLMANEENIAVEPKYAKKEIVVSGTPWINNKDTDQEYTSVGNHLTPADVEYYPKLSYSDEDIPDTEEILFDKIHMPDTGHETLIVSTYDYTEHPYITSMLSNDYERNIYDPFGIYTYFNLNKNVYADFTTQNLVSTGYRFKASSLTTFELQIFGGDVFPGYYSERFCPPEEKHDAIQNEHGVISYLNYASNNPSLRQEGDGWDERIYPYSHIPGGFAQQDENRPEGAEDALTNNFIKTNKDFKRLNVFNPVYPYERDKNYQETFSSRIHKGLSIQKEGLLTNIRKFPPLNYYEVDSQGGRVTNIESFSNEVLIHQEKDLKKTVSQTQMENSATSIVLGSGDLFKFPPQSLVTSESGYAGSTKKSSMELTRMGYTFIADDTHDVLLVSDKLKNITNTGNRFLLKDKMQLKLNKQIDRAGFPKIEESIPFYHGIGYLIGYDDYYNRLLITKRDYELDNTRLLDGEEIPGHYKVQNNKIFKFISDQQNSGRWFYVNPETDYRFRSRHITFSYSMDEERIAGFHDYFPSRYIYKDNLLYSMKEDYGTHTGFKHNVVDAPGFYFPENGIEVVIDIPFTEQNKVVWQSFLWDTEVKDSGNKYKETFQKALVYTDKQVSGIKDLSDIRYTQYWKFNHFRDLLKAGNPEEQTVIKPFITEDFSFDESVIDPHKSWYDCKRFIDNYIVLRLSGTFQGKVIYLHNISAIRRPSYR